MSKALKCDRCGGFYNPLDEADETTFVPRIVWRNAKSLKEQKTTRSRDEIDLCARCTKALDQFLEGSRKG